MTRSDLILAVDKAHREIESDKCDKIFLHSIVNAMHTKLECAYGMLFGLEKNSNFESLGKILREALES